VGEGKRKGERKRGGTKLVHAINRLRAIKPFSSASVTARDSNFGRNVKTDEKGDFYAKRGVGCYLTTTRKTKRAYCSGNGKCGHKNRHLTVAVPRKPREAGEGVLKFLAINSQSAGARIQPEGGGGVAQ
jgi:hypothetical protein